MAETTTSGRLFENALRKLSNGIVWKNMYKSMLGDQESTVDTIAVDVYTSGARYLLMYYSTGLLELVEEYTNEEYISFLNSGMVRDVKHIRYFDMFFFGEDISGLVEGNPFVRKTLPKYEEKNNYHRMLYGMPPLNCHPRYNLDFPVDPTDEDSEVLPLYKQPMRNRYLAEKAGYLDEWIEISKMDKSYEYVKYMTTKRIHPFVSRLANRYELLYVPESDIDTLERDFREVYEECTNFMILRYYSEAYRNQYEYYEGFIGLSILFMTLQRMHSKYLEADMTRDFYDLDSIRIVYEAYSVPFFETIPVDYHKDVVKAINRLISYKGSNTVFFDLFALFDYDTLSIYQYYLMKQHKTDEHGNPLFVRDSSGALDNRQMFDIKFVKGDIGGNPYKSVVDSNNDINYYGVTSADPFWLNDADLMDKVFGSNYNFIETKYIGVQLVFSLTKFLFETSYFMRMLMDNRDATSMMFLSNGSIGEVDIFTLIIYINAIVCLQLGVSGNVSDIFTDPTKLADVYGYNFVGDLSCIYEYLCRQYIANKDYDSSISDSLKIVADVINSSTVEMDMFSDFIHLKNDERYESDYTCSVCGKSKKPGMIPYCENDVCECNSDKNAKRYDNVKTIFNHTLNLTSSYHDQYYGIFIGLAESEDTIDEEYHNFITKIVEYVYKRSMDIPDELIPDHINIVKALKFKQELKDYICGVLDDNWLSNWSYFTDIIPMYYREDLKDCAISVRSFFKSYFKDPKNIDFDNIIRKYFLNNNAFENRSWGYENNTVIGSTAQNLVDSVAYSTISNDILNIINNDIKISSTGVFDGISSINESYNGIKKLYDVFTTLLWKIKDPKAFTAARRLQKMLLTTRYSEKIFTKKDGTLAATYMDLLEDLNPLLAIRIQGMDDSKLLTELDYSLQCLKKLADNLMYIQSYGSANTNRIVDYIYSLIRFFKSAKVELLDFSVEYIVDGKTTNMIKLMSSLRRGYSIGTLTPDEMLLYDNLRHLIETYLSDDSITFNDFLMLLERYMIIRDRMKIKDGYSINVENHSKHIAEVTLYDHVMHNGKSTKLLNNMAFKDVIMKID